MLGYKILVRKNDNFHHFSRYLILQIWYMFFLQNGIRNKNQKSKMQKNMYKLVFIYLYIFIYGEFLTPWNLKHKKWPKFHIFWKFICNITFWVTKVPMCKILHLSFDFDNINKFIGNFFEKSKMAANPRLKNVKLLSILRLR